MADSWASSEAIRRTMEGNRGRDTTAELAVRRLVHARGLRYRINYRPEPTLRRTGDLVFTKARVVVFIDGCYWHGCPEHFVMPVRNREFWESKIRRNQERDAETTSALRQCGWTVLRFWEHESPEACRGWRLCGRSRSQAAPLSVAWKLTGLCPILASFCRLGRSEVSSVYRTFAGHERGRKTCPDGVAKERWSGGVRRAPEAIRSAGPPDAP
ncbi:very short patch repair endonuclease [Nocardioides sp. W3-2-3]|uniref:very short patch repair endonuclease n=1 Tax=Nocardioides convexus TaxID=2712224 RepID=UPI0024188B89|nr:very short patch repair endonuclease [Nocardioides convexus]NHA00602.1 very short patch repair endonuclease [Nocardioides convexus]